MLTSFLLGITSGKVKERFDERLTIWPMQNGFNLLEFEYDFLVDFSTSDRTLYALDKFPRQIYELLRKTDGDIRRIETHLVQGRW